VTVPLCAVPLIRLAGLIALLFCLSVTFKVHAERLEQLFVGPELRVRPSAGIMTEPRYELALPHGLASPHAQLVARVGFVLPSQRRALVFPLTLGLRYAPWDTWIRPLLGADLGGYFSQARGPHAQGSPRGLAWTWSTRALTGAHVQIGKLVALRLYVDAAWAQTPGAVRTRDYVYSSLGAGAELLFTWDTPRWRLFDMLVRGTSAPEGW
jgi:hypothetical protein